MSADLQAPPAPAPTPASGAVAGRSSPAAGAPRLVAVARSHARVVALAAAFAVVASAYLLALASPLRLQPDSINYLSRALGLALPAHAQGYPPGYPAIVAALDHLGMGTAWALVGLNLVLLAAGLTAAYLLCRRCLGLSATLAALVCLGTLLSRTVSLFATTPLTEVPYFGVALVCVLVLSIADRRVDRERWALLGVAVALAAAAISIRILGLALIAPLLYVAVGRDRLIPVGRALRRGEPATLAVCAGSVIALVAVGVVTVKLTPYWRHTFSTWESHGGVGTFLDKVEVEMRTKIISLGELGSQTRCCLRTGTALRPAYVVLGLLVGGLIVYGWLGRRRFGVVEAFVLGTAAVIFVYAGGVPRFWIAVIPFLLAYAVLGGQRLARWRPPRYALAVFAASFVVIGGVWLVNSVVLSTAGRQFPSLWARQVSGRLQSSYRVAWGQARLWDLVQAQPAAVAVLHHYEPLARVWEW